MKLRAVFVCLFSLLIVSIAYGDGAYQRARDRKTIIWNNSPEPGDTAVWTGERDQDDYATGEGSVTWYSRKRSNVTGSNIPQDRFEIVGRYSGNMVRGKLEGVVTTWNTSGKTLKASFADGRRVSDWGDKAPASQKKTKTSAEAESAPESTNQLLTATKTSNDEKIPKQNKGKGSGEMIGAPEQVQPLSVPPSGRQPPALVDQRASPDSPAEGPPEETSPPNRKMPASTVSKTAPTQTKTQSVKTAAKSASGASVPAGSPAANASPVDNSLRSLIAPPTSLRERATTEGTPPPAFTPATEKIPSPPPGPQLTAAEATALADIEARTWGYDLGEYQLPTSEYNAAGARWYVVYETKNAEGKTNSGKHFSVTIDDKTKKAEITR